MFLPAGPGPAGMKGRSAWSSLLGLPAAGETTLGNKPISFFHLGLSPSPTHSPAWCWPNSSTALSPSSPDTRTTPDTNYPQTPPPPPPPGEPATCPYSFHPCLHVLRSHSFLPESRP